MDFTRRADGAATAFAEYFGGRAAAVYSAPGRTELGGNHTDHQGGRVVAAAVDLDAVCAARPNNSDRVRLFSPGFGEDLVDLTDLTPRVDERETSAALVRGIAAWFCGNGYNLGGTDIYLQSDVPPGSGLSSSAVFEVAVAAAMSGLWCGGRLSPTELAVAGRYAENLYFGKPCGLMDQMTAAFGGVIAMDFRDADKPIVRNLSFDLAAHGYAMCITSVGSSHDDLTADYAAIPDEMRSVARRLGFERLCDCDEDILNALLPTLRVDLGDRAVLRAQHFFGETRRAGLMADALAAGDIEGYLQLMRDSGTSSHQLLQNIYSPCNPHEQGISVALALSATLLEGRGGSRVHGGGFAGTIQTYVPLDGVSRYLDGMERVFGTGCCRTVGIRAHGAMQIL